MNFGGLERSLPAHLRRDELTERFKVMGSSTTTGITRLVRDWYSLY